jgi:hypothetical protein
MMPSTAWASRVLSPITLHSVFDTVLSMESQLKPADMWTSWMELGSMKALNSGWLKLNIHIN